MQTNVATFGNVSSFFNSFHGSFSFIWYCFISFWALSTWLTLGLTLNRAFVFLCLAIFPSADKKLKSDSARSAPCPDQFWVQVDCLFSLVYLKPRACISYQRVCLSQCVHISPISVPLVWASWDLYALYQESARIRNSQLFEYLLSLHHFRDWWDFTLIYNCFVISLQ